MKEDILPQGALAKSNAVLNRLGKNAPISAGEKVDILWIYDSTEKGKLQIAMRLIQQSVGHTPRGTLTSEAIVGVASWRELLGFLKKFSEIGEMRLFTHGSEGGDLFIAEEEFDVAYDAWRQAGIQGSLAKITRSIRFEGCNIGQGARNAIRFVTLFQAPTFYAWNFFRYVTIANVTFVDNEKANREGFRYWVDYVHEGYRFDDNFYRRPEKHQIPLEWFRRKYESDEKLDPQPDRTIFVPRRLAMTKILYARDVLNSLEEQDPIPPSRLELVQVIFD